MRITPCLGPAMRKLKPSQARIRVPNSTTTLDEGPCLENQKCVPFGHELLRLPWVCGSLVIRAEGFLSLAKGAAPMVWAVLNTTVTTVLKTAWLWCLREPRYLPLSSAFPLRTKRPLSFCGFFFFLDNDSTAYPTSSPTSLLPAKFLWLMGAILFEILRCGELKGRGQGTLWTGERQEGVRLAR